MHQLEKQVFTLCQENALFALGERLVVGVSGGPDSMALLHVLARLSASLGITLVVAHVDHGLRPEDAKHEEGLVCMESAALGLQYLTAHFEVKGHAQKSGASVEEAARELRYQFFDSVAKDHAASKIAVAHTADDQAEEILLRLIRGAGKKGLSGMTLLRDGKVVRPFLTIEKTNILSYLKDRRIPFAIDASNTDRRYLRNKIRLDLLPYMESYNPGLKRALRQTAMILRDEDGFIDEHVEREYALLIREGMSGDFPTAVASCWQLNQRHVAVRRRLFEKMLINLGVKPGYRQIDSLMGLAAIKDRGQIHLGNGLRALREEDEIRLLYPVGKNATRGNLLPLTPLFNVVVSGPGRYSIPEIGMEVIAEVMQERPSLEEMRGLKADFFDADCLTLPLLLRNRLAGDRLHPLNGKGGKTVAALLSDLRLPRAQRDKLPVLISAGHIAAVLGVRISHWARVTDSTSSVLKLTMRPT